MAKEIKSSSCQTGGCRIILFVLHALTTIVYACVTVRTYVAMQIPVSKPQGKYLGPLKYLTIWDIHFQLLISFLNVLVVITNSKRLTSIRNAVHHGLSLSYGPIVASLFWSLYLIDRRLVFPKELDPIIPPFVNHLLHTLVGITPIINELITYNERKSNHFLLFFFTFAAYLFQLLFFGYYLEFWIYPIFEVLSDVGRFVFLGFCICLGILVYLINGAAHNYIWNRKIKESSKKRN